MLIQVCRDGVRKGIGHIGDAPTRVSHSSCSVQTLTRKTITKGGVGWDKHIPELSGDAKRVHEEKNQEHAVDDHDGDILHQGVALEHDKVADVQRGCKIVLSRQFRHHLTKPNRHPPPTKPQCTANAPAPMQREAPPCNTRPPHAVLMGLANWGLPSALGCSRLRYVCESVRIANLDCRALLPHGNNGE